MPQELPAFFFSFITLIKFEAPQFVISCTSFLFPLYILYQFNKLNFITRIVNFLVLLVKLQQVGSFFCPLF
jgi:hypothetical protein